ncbi:TetR/AcrR family transcriptional regulator [Paractinoplanes rishiriensis]|uniref:TetR/AcrR family transcriptional regulator n=1 Tax=Paractinoplanes rishiriensis TaxID=1050105 RepID=UPI0019423E72|nr:helix-turn-helix domain-containing protein [Actinoplanes rishiriensis]
MSGELWRGPGVSPVDAGSRRADAVATRRLLLRTAERLFAERGVHAVSARQIAEAAGQGSNSAVGYHIGTKADLVAAIVREHVGPMDRMREQMLRRVAGSGDLRAHIACLVLPVTNHLEGLGVPSWYARFAAQVVIDPGLRTVVVAEATASPVMRRAMDGILALARPMPGECVTVRTGMVRHLIVHTCADREQDLADGNAPSADTWPRTGRLLIDAIEALLTIKGARL